MDEDPGARMEIDGITLPSGHVLETDVCIVGAGPAGITLAREFIGRDLRVVLLESGGGQPEAAPQALSDAITAGDRYDNPKLTHHRQAGGTANIWNTRVGAGMGAKYVPLDAVDFEERPWLPLSGWPFDRAHLDPFYERAQALCGLGSGRYAGADWADPGHPLLPLGGTLLTTTVYQLGTADPFTHTLLYDVRQSQNVLLCLHATAVELEAAPAGESLTEVRAICGRDKSLRVRSRMFVLATGAIENARLLLVSNRVCERGLGNQHDMVGRCLMDHPRDRAGVLIPHDRHLFDQCDFYDVHATAAGVVSGRLTFTEEALRRYQLLNMSVTVQPRPPGFRASAIEATRRVVADIGRGARSEDFWGSVGTVLTGLPQALPYAYRRWVLGYRAADRDWSGLANKPRRFGTFELLLNLEQSPDVDNRVTLSRERDPLGVPKPAIHWRWRELDRSNLDRIRGLLAQELARAAIGRLVILAETELDPNAHHHMGTTRMHRNPRCGVVDEQCRVHGIPNLFIAGSSVFPTGGCANPTLTIAALSLRLADRLRHEAGVRREAADRP
jgi:choline dehydrogenase-like flavoprotein